MLTQYIQCCVQYGTMWALISPTIHKLPKCTVSSVPTHLGICCLSCLEWGPSLPSQLISPCPSNPCPSILFSRKTSLTCILLLCAPRTPFSDSQHSSQHPALQLCFTIRLLVARLPLTWLWFPNTWPNVRHISDKHVCSISLKTERLNTTN